MLLIAWVFVVPIFESPDEPHHWLYTAYVHSHLQLPPYDSSYVEGNQGPLYYVLMSPFASPSATPPLEVRADKGRIVPLCPPHFFHNCPSDVHKYWPIRRVRLATAGLSLIGVLFTALAALEVTDSVSCSLIAAALIGFLPQFDFRGATVNNDAAAVVFSAMATYFIVRMLVRGFEQIPALFGSIAIALAFLSKINAVVLAPVFVACILLTAPNWKGRVLRLIWPALSGLIVLPWLLRNKLMYGDFLASDVMARTVPIMISRRTITDPYFQTTFPQLTSRSFIGYFGWMNIPLPAPIYRGYTTLFGIAIAGLLYLLLRCRGYRRVIGLLAAIPVMSLAVLIDFNLSIAQPQGRLLFPCLSALTILVTLGLSAIVRARRYVAAAVLFACVSVDMYALKDVIYPAYWRSKPSAKVQDVAVANTMMKGQPPGPLLPGHRFTQSFTAEHDDLSSVEMEVTGYPRAMKHGSFRISLSESEDGPPLVTAKWPASAIPNCCLYAGLSFRPLPHSTGKVYFISLSTEELIPPDAITVFLSGTDVYTKGTFSVDGKDTKQDTSFRTFYTPSNATCSSCPEPRSDAAK